MTNNTSITGRMAARLVDGFSPAAVAGGDAAFANAVATPRAGARIERLVTSTRLNF